MSKIAIIKYQQSTFYLFITILMIHLHIDYNYFITKHFSAHIIIKKVIYSYFSIFWVQRLRD